MKIYVAAPWKDRASIPPIAKRLEDAGHEITKKWWEVPEAKEGDPKSVDILRQQAIDDVNGVKNADLVLVINSAKSEGKAFEQGAAIALEKPIIIVGKRGEFSANVFHYLDVYRWVPDIDKAMEVLDTITWLLKYEGYY